MVFSKKQPPVEKKALPWLALIVENPSLVIFLLALVAWFFLRQPLVTLFCGNGLCWLYPDNWPILLGVTKSSSVLLIAAVCAILFALPFGRSGLLANLVAIRIGEPILGLAGVFLIFLVSSAISIVVVHQLVEQVSKHRHFSNVRKRLVLFEKLLAPSIGRHPILALGLGNLAGSQWHMSALGVIARVPREKIWLGLFLGNLAGFFLVYTLSFVPQLDAVTIVLLIVAVVLALSSPAILENIRRSQ